MHDGRLAVLVLGCHAVAVFAQSASWMQEQVFSDPSCSTPVGWAVIAVGKRTCREVSPGAGMYMYLTCSTAGEEEISMGAAICFDATCDTCSNYAGSTMPAACTADSTGHFFAMYSCPSGTPSSPLSPVVSFYEQPSCQGTPGMMAAANRQCSALGSTNYSSWVRNGDGSIDVKDGCVDSACASCREASTLLPGGCRADSPVDMFPYYSIAPDAATGTGSTGASAFSTSRTAGSISTSSTTGSTGPPLPPPPPPSTGTTAGLLSTGAGPASTSGSSEDKAPESGGSAVIAGGVVAVILVAVGIGAGVAAFVIRRRRQAAGYRPQLDLNSDDLDDSEGSSVSSAAAPTENHSSPLYDPRSYAPKAPSSGPRL